MIKHTIVIYNLLERDTKVTVATVNGLNEARLIMNKICSIHWTKNRRPDVHTIGDLCMTIIKENDHD